MTSSPVCAAQRRELMTDTATPTASTHCSHITALLRHRDVTLLSRLSHQHTSRRATRYRIPHAHCKAYQQWYSTHFNSSRNKMQSENGRLRPRCRHPVLDRTTLICLTSACAATWQTRRHLWFSRIRSIVWKHDVIHKTGSTSHCRRKKTEPRAQVTRTENFVKFGHVVFEMCQRTDEQTYRQTNRHADHNTSSTYRRSIISHQSKLKETVKCASQTALSDFEIFTKWIGLQKMALGSKPNCYRETDNGDGWVTCSHVHSDRIAVAKCAICDRLDVSKVQAESRTSKKLKEVHRSRLWNYERSWDYEGQRTVEKMCDADIFHKHTEDYARPGWTTSISGQDSLWKSQSDSQRTSTSMVWPTRR